MEDRQILIQIRQEMEQIKRAVMSIPKWISLTDVARDRGISRQSLYMRIQNGELEPEVDFKYIGNKIYIARSAVSRIQRKRS